MPLYYVYLTLWLLN